METITVKVKFIQMIWDNYQGSSGKPIVSSLHVNISADTKLCEIEDAVIQLLTKLRIKGTYDMSEEVYPYEKILHIKILPSYNCTKLT